MVAGQYGMTINGRFNFTEPYVPEAGVDPLPGIVDDSYLDTRGIVMIVKFCHDQHDNQIDTKLYDRAIA